MLCEALEGILSQTFTDYEVIIKDGNSSYPILKSSYFRSIFRKLGHRAKYLAYLDGSLFPGLNQALKIATGHIYNFHADDDVFASNDVLEYVDQLFKTSVTWAYGRIQNVNEFMNPCWASWDGGERLFTFEEQCQHNRVPFPSAFIREDLMHKLAKFNESYITCGDYELFLRCYTECNPVWIDKVISKYRNWPGQDSITRREILLREAAQLQSEWQCKNS